MITASDVGVLFNKDRFRDRATLTYEKATGKREDLSTNRYVWWGSKSEQHIVEAVGELTGCETTLSGSLFESTRQPRLGATLDGYITVPQRGSLSRDLLWAASGHWAPAFLADLEDLRGTRGALEVKNISTFSKKIVATGPPPGYVLQVQTQIFVRGLDFGVLAVKVGASDLRAFVIRADASLHDRICYEVTEFWKGIENDCID